MYRLLIVLTMMYVRITVVHSEPALFPFLGNTVRRPPPLSNKQTQGKGKKIKERETRTTSADFGLCRCLRKAENLPESSDIDIDKHLSGK